MNNLLAVLSGDVSADVSTSSLDTVFTNVMKAVKFSGDVLNVMIEHPIYGFLFSVSFVGVAVGIVAMLRRGSHG